MNALEKARDEDRNDNTENAIFYYEQYITELKIIDNKILIDTAFLYFLCCDFGYASAKKIDSHIQEIAYTRAIELLDFAKRLNGPLPELEFWSKYFAFVCLGEPDFRNEALSMAQKGCIEAYFYLYDPINQMNEFRDKALLLYEKVEKGLSAKERYIRSILKNSLFRNRNAKG